MYRQIIVTEDLVFYDGVTPIEYNCSVLSPKGFVFIGEDADGMWGETVPYTGRIPLTNTEEVEEIYAKAKEKALSLIVEVSLEEQVRDERDSRLRETDWMVLPDSPYDTQEVHTYRQALRDITEQAGFPWNGPNDPDCPWPVLEVN